jgi:gamma-glutamyltranspeptidase/glutathione hydrolase
MSSTKIAIAADSPETVSAGQIIAENGGNAVDVAVGCALAASLAEVLMCSLGGSAFISIKLPGEKPVVIDGADAMPTISRVKTHAWREVVVPYGDGIAVNVGHGSIAIPGMLKALEETWKRYGHMPWKEVMVPVIQMAKKGVTANITLAAWLELAGKPIFYPQIESRKSFFPTGSPIRENDIFTLPNYDQTLEAIAAEGARVFYEGHIAEAFEQEIQSHDGYLKRIDMANYRAIIREPLIISSQNYKLALNPPPSIGGAMVGSMIGMIDSRWDSALSTDKKTLLVAKAQESMLNLRHEEAAGQWCDKRAFQILERERLKNYLDKRMSPHTLHMSIISSDGAAVSITMSNGYGSGITIPGTGITCNNSLGEPELNPHGFFTLKPQERFVSNMSPAVAWNEEGRVIALGSPGASRITTAITQGWINLAHNKLDPQTAVNAPRLHVDYQDDKYVVQYEPGVNPNSLKQHFKLRPFENKDMYFGAFNIAIRYENGRVEAVADSRRHGATYHS